VPFVTEVIKGYRVISPYGIAIANGVVHVVAVVSPCDSQLITIKIHGCATNKRERITDGSKDVARSIILRL
jgi:hypothetical protein